MKQSISKWFFEEACILLILITSIEYDERNFGGFYPNTKKIFKNVHGLAVIGIDKL